MNFLTVLFVLLLGISLGDSDATKLTPDQREQMSRSLFWGMAAFVMVVGLVGHSINLLTMPKRIQIGISFVFFGALIVGGGAVLLGVWLPIAAHAALTGFVSVAGGWASYRLDSLGQLFQDGRMATIGKNKGQSHHSDN